MSRKPKPPKCKHCGKTVDTPPADWPLEECVACLKLNQWPALPGVRR